LGGTTLGGAARIDEFSGTTLRHHPPLPFGALEFHAATEGDAEELGLDVIVADARGLLETKLVTDTGVYEEPVGDSEACDPMTILL
jgi:hypothetical protein